VLPPTVAGYLKADQYGFTGSPNGDVTKAKAALQKCGQPNGFTVNIAARGDRPRRSPRRRASRRRWARSASSPDPAVPDR